MESLWEVTNALSNGTIPVLLRPPLPQDWVLQPHAKTAIAIISGTGKATNFQFCVHILSIDRKKVRYKFQEK